MGEGKLSARFVQFIQKEQNCPRQFDVHASYNNYLYSFFLLRGTEKICHPYILRDLLKTYSV